MSHKGEEVINNQIPKNFSNEGQHVDNPIVYVSQRLRIL